MGEEEYEVPQENAVVVANPSSSSVFLCVDGVIVKELQGGASFGVIIPESGLTIKRT